MASSTSKITLVSSDCKRFLVDVAVARKSYYLRNAIKLGWVDGPIYFSNITGKSLELLIQYCKMHAEFFPVLVTDDEFVPESDSTNDELAAEHDDTNALISQIIDNCKFISLITTEYRAQLEYGACPGVDVRIMGNLLSQFIEDYKNHLEATDPGVKNRQIHSQVIENYKRHHTPSVFEEELRDWDAGFVQAVDRETLIELMKAGQYLGIPSLVNLTMQDLDRRLHKD